MKIAMKFMYPKLYKCYLNICLKNFLKLFSDAF